MRGSGPVHAQRSARRDRRPSGRSSGTPGREKLKFAERVDRRTEASDQVGAGNCCGLSKRQEGTREAPTGATGRCAARGVPYRANTGITPSSFEPAGIVRGGQIVGRTRFLLFNPAVTNLPLSRHALDASENGLERELCMLIVGRTQSV